MCHSLGYQGKWIPGSYLEVPHNLLSCVSGFAPVLLLMPLSPPQSLSFYPTWSSTRPRLMTSNAQSMLPPPITFRQSGPARRRERRRLCRSLPLCNFFCAVSSTFVFVFLFFLVMVRATVIRDAQFTSGPALSKTSGVRACPCRSAYNADNGLHWGSC